MKEDGGRSRNPFSQLINLSPISRVETLFSRFSFCSTKRLTNKLKASITLSLTLTLYVFLNS